MSRNGQQALSARGLISSRTRTASCSLFWLADMHPKFHASSSFVTSIFLQYLANAVRACWGVIAFGSALVPALYPISLRWLLYESPYDHGDPLGPLLWSFGYHQALLEMQARSPDSICLA
ncbi:hypothetical protein EMIHUDRAFT_215784 [Emiliania huxleyi CCMP1516]|uniref:Uncharacterized protein n=2 Tax=Emiliania huxleyi TaxID=2903 RepID=A0A0D3IGY0_EMIH1|nr:hypothetical protein EMIHUDRAFT_215784 [Emiliania huxleyi CCMP1516]EOD10515.1 hypothetical protein EMIHUDRAFT_215784 [Emiliania huxleyi CCMP1516]|eukprot:XP_005762944.1 hypothetical protein EMIHUDRAFT_215784 [Emiliania huxleyi CCMP1516]